MNFFRIETIHIMYIFLSTIASINWFQEEQSILCPKISFHIVFINWFTIVCSLYLHVCCEIIDIKCSDIFQIHTTISSQNTFYRVFGLYTYHLCNVHVFIKNIYTTLGFNLHACSSTTLKQHRSTHYKVYEKTL